MPTEILTIREVDTRLWANAAALLKLRDPGDIRANKRKTDELLDLRNILTKPKPHFIK